MMLFSFLRIRHILFFVLSAFFLTGCMGKPTPATRFYVLSPLGADVTLVGETENRGAISVEVASLRLPQYLDRPHIVTRSSENRLKLAEFHQWGGNLRKNMMRTLARNLSQLLATPNITIAPYRPPIPPDFLIDMEVMQFERNFGGQVQLSTQWRLSRGEDREVLKTQITDLTSPTATAGSDFERIVSDMSLLLGELSQIIGQEILMHIDGKL
ncbi:membrane integrity-associated transporter subunit PqiC [Thermodesulfobacteriota bacterium]